MRFDRRDVLGLMLGAALSPVAAGRAVASTREILTEELASGRACGKRAAAVRGTLARLARSKPPTSGRAVVVDVPSQHLAAYEDGRVVLESKVVVGDRSWATPDLDTSLTFVRFNPTWTVPESIVSARGWREKLARQPGYFSKLNFGVEVGGRLVDPREAAADGGRAARFVQRPGPGNALGRVKIGLAAGGSVYLHDTSDPQGFDEDARAISHGCVRVERAMDLAAWALGIEVRKAEDLLYGDDRKDRVVPGRAVRMVTTYFTAWPDDSGVVRYYPDVYGKDAGGGTACPRGYDPDEDYGDPPGARSRKSGV